MNDAKINVTVLFGVVKIQSWVAPGRTSDNKPCFVGMGSATRYDEHGRKISYKAEPTGAILTW